MKQERISTHKWQCEAFRKLVVPAINESIVVGTFLDEMTRSELYEIIYSKLGIGIGSIQKYPAIMTVIKEEMENIFNQRVLQFRLPTGEKVRGYRGIKRIEVVDSH